MTTSPTGTDVGPAGSAAVDESIVDMSTVDDADWDGFVGRSEPGSYLQLSPWARVKAVNGWSARRIEAHPPDGRIGAQVLVRRPRSFPWAFAYAPRGPVATAWTADAVGALTDRLRSDLAANRISHVRIDPEVELGGPLDPDGALRRALRGAGWRPGVPIQPIASRVIDLRADETALWTDLRKKWRQYVNRARTSGIRVVEADGDRLAEFYRIYRETAARVGFPIRTEQAYRDVWDAYRPLGLVRLLFAETADHEAQATLLLVRCGGRVVEPYGGMTAAGRESRANYLLKWEAIRSSKEEGAATYDLWGLASGGVAWFKTGFGGREIRYVGPWDLVLDPLGRHAYEAAVRGRFWWTHRGQRGPGGLSASAFTGDAG